MAVCARDDGDVPDIRLGLMPSGCNWCGEKKRRKKASVRHNFTLRHAKLVAFLTFACRPGILGVTGTGV